MNEIVDELIEIELVAGPMCGAKVKWPKSEKLQCLKHQYGYAVYSRDSETTAVYTYQNKI